MNKNKKNRNILERRNLDHQLNCVLMVKVKIRFKHKLDYEEPQ